MLTAFDVGFGVLVLISAILATARGLTREILSLVTWAGSAALAAYMYFKHPDIARSYINDPRIADVATVAVTFIVCLVVLHLVTMRIADFVVDSRIGPLDRTLGFVFGVLRGIVIAVVVVIFGLYLFTNKPPLPGETPDYSQLPEWAAQSKSLPFLGSIGEDLIAALPPNLVEQVNNVLKHGKTGATTDNGATTEDNGGNDQTAPGDSTTTAPDVTQAPAAPAPAAPAAPAPAAPAAPGGGSQT
jgi:membrane protein required for colicin V production